MTKEAIAIDQFGQVIRGIDGNCVRKSLLEKLGAKHADKMYIDTKDGPRHIGYIIQGRWLTVYFLERMNKEP